MTEPQSVPGPIWTPLQDTFFRALWIAQLVSNIGTWMQSVAAAWMMTTLSPSPVMVALVQTASSIPVFFIGFAAGAVADIIDRRALLILTQVWMLIAAAVLSFLTYSGTTTPFLLLLLTFLLGLGSAFMTPAFQAIFPDLVRKRTELPAAVTLNGVSINIARSLGPALGGIVVALAGPGPVFLLNAISFVGVILVLLRWQQPARWSPLPAERLFGAMRTGFQYARYAKDLKVVLVRTGVFITFASALWALLPLVARFGLGVGADVYGLLLGSIGLGSIIGAASLPTIRRRLSVNKLVTIAEIVFAGATVALGYLPSLPLLILAMVAGGVAWLSLMASFNVMVQTVVPAWVQARALGLYVTVFMGCMAFSSILWGVASDLAGVPVALFIAGAGLVLSIPATMRAPVKDGVHLDLSPALRWPEPRVVIEPRTDAGPVLVTVEYRVESPHEPEFLRAMQELGRLRRRDGALDWGLFRDVADPSRFVEFFLTDSWIEHLRQHERITVADLEIEGAVRAYHTGEAAPRVHHFVSAFDFEAEPGSEGKR
jgi:MFS family permease